MNNRTTVAKPADITRVWYEIDASGVPIGRVAVKAAKLLIGKHKSNYTPHIDGGDYVVIINTQKAILTGRKSEESMHHYSGYPSGLKSTKKHKIMATNPEKLLKSAIYGMVPVNKLRPNRMARLKIFASDTHTHSAQQPKKVEIK